MGNHDVLYKFGKAWSKSEGFRTTAVGNFLFRADVSYTSGVRGEEAEDCTVQVFRNGIEDGNIEIYACGVLQPETHHLGVNVKFQTYSLDDASESLIVRGSSPKMGDYQIWIFPNGREPSFF